MNKHIEQLRQKYANCADFKERCFNAFKTKAYLFFLESMTNEELLSNEVILPLLENKENETANFENISSKIVITTIKEIDAINDVFESIAKGNSILCFENSKKFIEIPLRETPERAIIEPPSSNVVRGPREGFNENYKTNIGLIRARLQTQKLKIEELVVGDLTQTKVEVLYLEGIADRKIVKEITDKIKKIKIDGVLDSFYIQSFLAVRPKSIFKQCGITEKPDIAAAKLLEGRIAIIVQGSPIILTLPFIFFEDFQSSEDYYEENKKVTFMRVLRILGLMLAIIMPAVYISFQLYHYKALPFRFLVTILNASASIPLAPLGEILFAFLLFEILFEASIRIPKGLGSSFNIMGALILGDTAIKSNLASAPTIMIVAVSSIALYLIPDQTSVMRIIRISLTLIAGMIGLIGVVIGVVFIFAYLSDFDAYGAPYLAPYAPRVQSDLKDGIFKKPLFDMKTRPKSFPTSKKER